MNKIFNVNLGGLPFSIDDDAFEVLNQYLRTLRQHFSQSDDCDEIMGDIESRLAELFTTALGSRGQIIVLRDVQNAIATMGTPEDFGIETTEKQSNTHKKTTTTEGGEKRRLFRDPDEKALGGVCGGLAAYFGLRDAIWLRLAFLVTVSFGGMGVFIYAILWLVIPEAKTSADRLAMRGEPANVENIARTIEEGATQLGNRFSEFDKSGKIANALQSFGNFLNAVIKGFARVFQKMSFILLLIFLIALLGVWVSCTVGLYMVSPFFSYLMPEQWWQSWLFSFNVFVFFLVPTVSIVIFLIRVLLQKRMSLKTAWIVDLSMWIFWFVNISSAAILAANFSTQFNHNASEVEMLSYTPSVSPMDTLNIVRLEHPNGQLKINLGDIYVSKEYLLCSDVSLKLVPATSKEWSAEIRKYAEGSTPAEAKTLVSSIKYIPNFNKDTFSYWETLEVPAGTKWRGQRIELVVKVPIGKKVKLGDLTHSVRYESYEDGDDDSACFDDEEPNSGVFEMGAKGLFCAEMKQNPTFGYREEGDKIIFHFERPTAFPRQMAIKNVTLAGDFNDWNPNDKEFKLKKMANDTYELEVKKTQLGQKGEKRFFKFVVNESFWVKPPRYARNQEDDGKGNVNLMIQL